LIASVSLANLTGVAEAANVTDDLELTPADVAREFKVSTPTVRRWGARGWLVPTRRLPGSRHRRYTRTAVEEFRRRYEAGEFDGIDGVDLPPTAPNSEP
jgi:hypothetical protein